MHSLEFRKKTYFLFYISVFVPVIGLLQAVQRLENSSPKQSAQYGLSSLNQGFLFTKILVNNKNNL